MKMKMKMVALAIAFCSLVACKKNNDNPPSTSVYEQNIGNIKKNEPVLLTFSNSDNTVKVNWTVTPSTGVVISAVGNTATVTFSTAGTYKVVATAAGVSATYNVEVVNVEYNNFGTAFNVTASKQVNVNPQESVLFVMHNAAAGSQISSGVSMFPPNYYQTNDTANKTTTVHFTGGGFAIVTISDGVNSEDRAIWVNDPANSDPDKDTVSFILGEKLRLTPAVVSIGGSKQLVIQTTTTNTYHCPSDRLLSFAESSSFVINYGGVVISPEPCNPMATASCTNSFSNNTPGTYPFIINFGNRTYKGTLTISSTSIYTFNWPDASAVSISPLQVQ